MMKYVAALGLLSVGFVPVSNAQDISGNANFGEVTLSSGFTPDPYVVGIVSGGNIDADSLGGSCRGRISNNPDFRLRWSAGSGSLPLIISASSSEDTTLVINAPDGRWYCNDDGGQGLNPSFRFNNPRGGRYEIWVGSYSGGNHSADLVISELTSE